MPRHENISAIRKKKAAQLRKLGEILRQKVKVCSTPEALNRAADECKKDQFDGRDKWGYRLEGLLFNINKPRHTIPCNTPKNLRLELNVDIVGECNTNSNDKLRELAVDIEISATNDGRKCLCAWHLDRHICNNGDNNCPEVHPLYHFHHGGKRAREQLCDNLGQAIITDPPRVGHPPLDGIMAVDFVLANFVSSQWQNLRLYESAYVNIVQEIQEELWKPYYESLNKAWGPTPTRIQAYPLMPTLV